MTPAIPPSAPPAGAPPPGAVPVRRPRSPGRRSFSPGTDEQWEQALQDPALQKALSDPQIQQALAANLDRLQASVGAGAMPRPRRTPMHFQGGGSMDSSGITSAQVQQLLQTIKQLQTQLQMQQQTSGAGTTSSTGTTPSTSILGQGGIGGAVSGLVGGKGMTGPPTMMNTLGPAALGGILGLGAQTAPGKSSVPAALIGAGTAGLLSYLVRKLHQPAVGGDQSGETDPMAGITTGPNMSTDYTQARPFAPGATSAPGAMPGTPDQFQMPATEEALGNIPGGLDENELASNAPLLEGEDDFARGGSVGHDDAAQDRKQTLGILKEKKLVKARGGFHADQAEESPVAPAKKPKAVLLRKPMGHAIPVISTTIVLGKKKPPAKAGKNKGGAIAAAAEKKASEKKAAPAPYKKGGHVQVPRGTGAAIRGKRFQGIY